jgi:hypothetical protein
MYGAILLIPHLYKEALPAVKVSALHNARQHNLGGGYAVLGIGGVF